MSKLDFQALSVPLLPLNTRADKQASPVGQLTLLENGRYHKVTGEGSYSIKKRPGQATLTGATFPNPHRIGRFGDDLVAQCKGGIYRWSRSNQSTALICQGATWTPTLTGVQAATGGAAGSDACYVSGGYTVVTQGSVYSVTDATGATIANNVSIGATNVACIASGSAVVFFGLVGTTLASFKISMSAPSTVVAGGTVATPGAAAAVQVNARGSSFDVYVFSTSATGDALYEWDASTMLRTRTCLLTHADTGGAGGLLTHDAADGNIYVATINSAAASSANGRLHAIAVSTYTVTTSAITGPPAFSTAMKLTGWVEPTTFVKNIIVTYLSNGATMELINKNGAPLSATSGIGMHCRLWSRAWYHGGAAYCVLSYAPTGTYQPTGIVVDMTNVKLCGVMLRSVFGGHRLGVSADLSSAGQGSSSDQVIVGVSRRAIVIPGAPSPGSTEKFSQSLQVGAVVLDAADTRLASPVEFAGSTYIPGGIPRTYDGVQCTEAGFILDPETPTGTTSAGAMTAGTRSFVGIYESYDASGRVCRSAPCVPLTLVMAASQRAFITFRLPNQTLRSSTFVALYRTIAGGTVFYKVAPSGYAVTAASGIVAIEDNTTDAALVAGEPLYAQIGSSTRENSPPPACTSLAPYGDRLFAISSETGAVHYTKSARDNIAPAWAPDFVIPATNEDGRWTAMMQHEATLYLWKTGSVYGLSGDGPTDIGGGTYYEAPPRVSTGHGCAGPLSVLPTPAGPAFLATRGVIMMLSDVAALARQGAKAEALGEPLFDYSTLTIRGSVLAPNKNLAIWFSSEGTALVYDYVTGGWSVDRGRAALGACWSASEPTWVLSDGSVVAESTGSVSDNGSAIVTKAEVVLNLGGIGGYARMRRGLLVGEYVGAHTAKISISYDGHTTADDTHTRAMASGDAGNYRVAFAPRHGKATVFRLTLEDVYGTASGGAIWTGLSVDVGTIARQARGLNTRKMTGV